MKKYFVPNASYPSVKEIDFERLLQKNISYLFFDLDNTLGLFDQALPHEEMVIFLNRLIQMGFHIFVFSNNHEKRVQEFAQGIPCPYLSEAKKPSGKRLLWFLNKNGIPKSQVAMIGDQVLTDVFMANRLGVFSILTQPISKRELLRTKFNRKIEFLIKWIYGIHYHKKISETL